MRKQWLALVCGAAMLPIAFPVTVNADDAKKSETPAEKAWDIQMSASYLLQNGNTKSQSIAGKINASHDTQKWRQTFKAEAVNTTGQNDNGNEVRTAERYYGSYKLDRKYSKNNYLFNIVTYQKDRFSGYFYQASYALGIGHRFINTDSQTLDMEAGPGYRVQCLEPASSYLHCGNSDDSFIGRAAAKYKWKISKTATFGEELSSESGGGNTSTRSETSLTSKINDHFAMQLSYLITHDSTVPAGNHNTDQETSVSLVYTY